MEQVSGYTCSLEVKFSDANFDSKTRQLQKHEILYIKSNLDWLARSRNLTISYDCSVRLRDLCTPLRRQEGLRRLPQGIHQHQGRAGGDGARQVGPTGA